MPISYDENGLQVQTLLEILEERQEALATESILGSDFVINPESVAGNLQLADADREFAIQELISYFVSQLDPDTAEGIFLDYICALNNIDRINPQKTTFPRNIVGDAGTVVDAYALTIQDTSTGYKFINIEEVTLDSGGVIEATFECLQYGDIDVENTATFTISTPILGISSIERETGQVTTVGNYRETDDELRVRREYNLQKTASSTLSSIKETVQNVTGVTKVVATENDTSSTVGGIPAKAFELIVLGGTDSDIAKAILSKKPTGIQSYGTTTVSVEDDDDNTFSIGFTRPSEVPIAISITISVSTVQNADWIADKKDEIVELFDSKYTVGSTIYAWHFYNLLSSETVITDVSNLQVGEVGESLASSVELDSKECPTLSVDNITITQTV